MHKTASATIRLLVERIDGSAPIEPRVLVRRPFLPVLAGLRLVARQGHTDAGVPVERHRLASRRVAFHPEFYRAWSGGALDRQRAGCGSHQLAAFSPQNLRSRWRRIE